MLAGAVAVQAQPAVDREAFEAKRIVFYGYDFSLFHFVGQAKNPQELKTQVLALAGEIQARITNDKLKQWLNKSNILNDNNHVSDLNKAISAKDLAVRKEAPVEEDSLQRHLKRYTTRQKNGIGHVVVFECFDGTKGRLTAYSLFFDIETKNILLSSWAAFGDLGRANNLSGLKSHAVDIVEYLDKEVYRAKEKKAKKGN